MIRGSLTIPHTIDYVLQAPDTPGPWPVLLALHGFGQSAESFARILAPLAQKGILVAVPQAPNQFYLDMKGRKVGFTWLTRHQRDRSMADLVVYLERFWGRVQEECGQADPGRLSILGFSQGVSIAYRLWLYGKLPLRSLFACGSDLPPDVAERLDAKPPIPVRIIHGRRDVLVSMVKPLQALDALRTAGFDAHLEEFQAGHELTAEMLDYVARCIESLEG